MKTRFRFFLGLFAVLPVAAQGVPGSMSAGAFLAQGLGAEKDLYRGGGGLQLSWHFQQGSPVQGRLRSGLFALGSGARKGRFGVSYDARSEGLWVGWDFLFVPSGRAVLPFIGLGGCGFRYSYRSVPDQVTSANPANPPVRSERDTTAALGASAGFIVPVGRSMELEFRYTLLKHPAVVAFGPVGEGFLGDSFDPTPSHLAVGLSWRF